MRYGGSTYLKLGLEGGIHLDWDEREGKDIPNLGTNWAAYGTGDVAPLTVTEWILLGEADGFLLFRWVEERIGWLYRLMVAFGPGGLFEHQQRIICQQRKGLYMTIGNPKHQNHHREVLTWTVMGGWLSPFFSGSDSVAWLWKSFWYQYIGLQQVTSWCSPAIHSMGMSLSLSGGAYMEHTTWVA